MTITHNYFLRCVTSAQLTNTYPFVTTITYYTLALHSLITRSRRLTSQLSLLSQIITHSTSSHFPCLTRRAARCKLVANWMHRHFRSAYDSLIGPANNASCCPVGLSEERLFPLLCATRWRLVCLRSSPWKRCSCYASHLTHWPLPSNAK
jgi:hypothetical protein